MFLFAVLPMFVGHLPQDATYRVVESRRTLAFAGKLGHRVEDRLIVTRDGERYEVSIGRRHTRIHGVLPEYRVGDVIRLHGVASANRIFVLPDGVELVRTESRTSD